MKKKYKIWFAILGLLLILSVGFIIYVAFFGGYSLFYMSYQQSPNEIYIMESGILYNQLEFKAGNDYEISYDFDNEEYKELLEKYDIANIAKDGSEFEKAKNLMNEFAPRLKHKSDYDNHIDMNALSLLEYSLDNNNHGINCRNKAQILNEMCLALGIYSRKVWIMPNSKYDGDCHVVNEVWDSTYNKWIMLDITNNMYWVDENGNPLSILEIRTKIANQEFCTPVDAEDNLKDLDKSLNNNFDNFLYIAKNLVYMEYMGKYTKNEDDTFYLLFPENLNTSFEYIISEKAIEASPK
ncbi:MAG: transglutaminase domain-containing protein [Lachnospiraceae bacterium]|nr:transglutaminase domain-containing protein [Lachnospiraceae bacterium]